MFSAKGYFTTGGALTGITPSPQVNDPEQSVQADSRELKAYPNPATDKIQIEYESQVSGIAELSILDSKSKTVLSKKIQVTKGINNYLINTTEFGSGVYFISIKNSENVLIRRIIIGH